MFSTDVEQYLLYVSRMQIKPSLSNFIRIYKSSIVSDFAKSKQTLDQYKRACCSSFSRETLKKLDKNDFDLDGHLVNWLEIGNEALESLREESEQRLRRTREEATWDTFEQETNNVSNFIRKRQAEASTMGDERNRRQKVRDTLTDENEASRTSMAVSNEKSAGEDSTEGSELGIINDTLIVRFVDAVFSESSSINDYNCATCSEHATTESTTSKKSVKCMWSFALSEIDTITTEKVDMITVNEEVKNAYDSCHALATSGGLRASDHEKRLHLSGLFDCESANYDITPISETFIVSEVRIPEIDKQNIARLVSALNGKSLLTLESHTTMEELQLNHIIMDMYLNIINKKIATESSELQLIAKYLSCLFNSLWSSHDHIKLKWDKPSAATMKSDPKNCKTRPDIIFYTNINEKEIELGNAEIKKKAMQKTKVDEACTRILSVCKRQLHLKMKQTHKPEELVTFSVLVHGFRYELYITSYVDGFYPFEKFAWGEFASVDNNFMALEKTFNVLLQLKNSMIRSLPEERAPTAESNISE